MRGAFRACFLRAMGWRFGRSVGWARIVALGLVAALLALRVADPVPVQIVRNLTFDFYQQMKPREPAPFPVAIIDVESDFEGEAVSRLADIP